MAGRYLDIDPEFALERADCRIPQCRPIYRHREAVGVAAYVAEEPELALRELATTAVLAAP